jgi:RNA polymerase sigma factor (TIGR02999 family)
MSQSADVTALLEAAGGGDRQAFDRVVPLVYDELHRIARRQLGGEHPDHTLNTSALVHEAYLRLVGLDHIEWRGRSHFFAAAAGAMRRILIDHANHRRALKRGGGDTPLTLAGIEIGTNGSLDDLIELDRALERLGELDERQARVVECRFFAGMTIEETAEVLDIGAMTVKRDWTAARAWLNRELSG